MKQGYLFSGNVFISKIAKGLNFWDGTFCFQDGNIFAIFFRHLEDNLTCEMNPAHQKWYRTGSIITLVGQSVI